jgi:hypothetical protein
MPRFDKTGPKGNGPLTGRRLGGCINNEPGKRYPQGGAPVKWGVNKRRGLGKGNR